MKPGTIITYILIVTVLLLGPIGVSWALNADYEGDGNNLDLSKLQKGDVIVMKGVKKYADLIGNMFPGYWHHTAVAISSGGDAEMVEAWPGDARVIDATSARTADEAAIYRVNTGSSVKNNAVNFMLGHIGKPYDYSWLIWPGGKSTNSYYWYCSELNWAGYKVNGVDIDQNPGYHWKYWNNVAPGELADDYDTWEVTRSK
ncbi:MAG: YiiX/YebB-like N1pC/P60 family cysteine hydrolase [Desulfovibrionales bacterium]